VRARIEWRERRNAEWRAEFPELAHRFPPMAFSGSFTARRYPAR
jgi:hypothetical protein